MKHAKYWMAALAALIVGLSHLAAHKLSTTSTIAAQINVAGTTVFVVTFLVFLFLPKGGK